MIPIIVEFAQSGSVLLYRCIQIPEQIRGKRVIAEDTPYTIRSVWRPEIQASALFLWGSAPQYDTGLVSHAFKTYEAATDARVAFTSLIRKWNAENAESGKPTQYAGVWVRAKDEMPNNGDLVLVMLSKGTTCVAKLHSDDQWLYMSGDGWFQSSAEVTHWARITPPAQEKPVTRTETLTWEVVQ